MSKIVKSIRKVIFKKAKDSLPNSIVCKIQRRRLEHSITTPSRERYQAKSTYSVITAVYNVEKYLNDFFENLTNQTIERSALRIIAIDDGSTDTSAEIINAWRSQYPEMITYIKKENGGQASARNLGLKHVSTEWVTFIDPDDYVSIDYFEQVDRVIAEHPNMKMVSTYFVFFLENKERYRDNHPLRNRFGANTICYNAQDDKHPIQLSMSTAFFNHSEITSQCLTIDEHLRPVFEDAHFVNKYLINLKEGMIAFCPDAKYYYRKRKDSTSTMDGAWKPGSGKLDLVLERGHLDLLDYAMETKGYVPRYIQETVLYDLYWYFKMYIGRPDRCAAFVSNGEAAAFHSILHRIFRYINYSTIETMSCIKYPFEWLPSIASFLPNSMPTYDLYMVTHVEPSRRLIQIATINHPAELFLDGIPFSPIETKRQNVPLLGRSFSHVFRQWYQYDNESQVISCRFRNAARVYFQVRGKRFGSSTTIASLVKRFTKDWDRYQQSNDTWIIMDRDTQADDNGEHFFRYMKAHHPDQKCYFVLRQDSPDWDRLKADGFNLLNFGSPEHERILRKCSKIISSHADPYVHSYFGDNFFRSKDYIFLQHGVTKDDLSGWLNQKPISIFVTSTKSEWISIAGNDTNYTFTPRNVALTGFPRHDALLEKSASTQRRTILIMPTWRKYLMGETTGKGNDRKENPDFSKSQYRIAWESLLNSETLHAISESTNTQIVFFPHANITPYLNGGYFKIPEYCEIASNASDRSIQDYFKEAAILITDYSSVAFDVAFLHTPCIYYQFDKTEFFTQEHAYAKGYFDYEEDGFGPVVYDEEELFQELTSLSNCNFKLQQPYKTRIDNTFVFRDGKCCERVYQAIIQLDKPNTYQ